MLDGWLRHDDAAGYCIVFQLLDNQGFNKRIIFVFPIGVRSYKK